MTMGTDNSSDSSSSDSEYTSHNENPTEDFKVIIKERSNENEEYKRPELLKKATEEIEAEVAAKADESSSEYESDSDEEEDDDAIQLTPAVDSQIFRTIAAIRAKDPRVYDDVDFFKDVKSSDPVKTAKKEKAMTLKDYERDLLFSHGGYVDEESEAPRGMTHREEQENLRNAFKELSDDDDDDEEDDFLTKKEKTAKEQEDEESEYKKFLMEQMKNDKTSQKVAEEWDNYKGNSEVNPEDAFLMDYVLNRGWVEKAGESKKPLPTEDEVDEDEADLDDIDRFESKYNFRYEEEGGASIQTYVRNIDGSVRRKESKRARRRAKLREHKELLKKQKVEEMKEQKNKKMKEIQQKLREIYEISGSKAMGLENIDLDADFDPKMFDAQMENVFDNEYYDAQDNEKPTWDDDIDTSFYEDETNMDADYLPGGDKFNPDTKRKRADDYAAGPSDTSKKHKSEQIEQLMDEYYSLNYEDVLGGDVYTRFKYAKTEADDYGLTPEEILLADDAELNKYVGIKQLAPYRPYAKVQLEKAHFKKNKKMKRRDMEKHIANIIDNSQPSIPEKEKSKKKSKKEKSKSKKTTF